MIHTNIKKNTLANKIKPVNLVVNLRGDMTPKQKVKDFTHQVMSDDTAVSDAVNCLFAKNALIHSMLNTQVGTEGMTELCQQFLHGLPDLEISSIDYVGMGKDKVFLQWLSFGTHQNEFFGLKPTGNTVHYGGMAFFDFDDEGSVSNYNVTVDMLNLMQQLGMNLTYAKECTDNLTTEEDKPLIEALQKFGHENPILSEEKVHCLALWLSDVPIRKIATMLNLPTLQIQDHIAKALYRLGCDSKQQLQDLAKAEQLDRIFVELHANLIRQSGI